MKIVGQEGLETRVEKQVTKTYLGISCQDECLHRHSVPF